MIYIFLVSKLISVSGAYHLERATSILSLCHDIFTDRSILRFLFPRRRNATMATILQPWLTEYIFDIGHP